ncbi:Diverse 7TM receptor transmembrane region [Marinomonas posidonica IVIA-Po-181]|uniref:Diverse 7TM receptor transmembrane region n=1 Tax=Marinomonas posidonica (strain CECT 7376 / NCIMB 14433 / IVIA-Po-181) TaxID=491952 RepID=F6CUL0_MARPP|nr:Diverse 7TM receptor transmembrane region [Marinomonas posidonica IVIA-Po-181]
MRAFTDIVWASILLHRFILLFLLCASNIAWGKASIAIIDDTHSTFNIGQSAFYYLDETQSLSYQDISSDYYSKRFRPLARDYLQFGMVKGNIWIRTEAAVQTTIQTPIILDISAPRLQRLDLFLPNLYGHQAQVELGGARPYANLPIEGLSYAYPIPSNIPPIFTIYIKMSSHLPINANIELKTLSEATKDSQNEILITGLLIGILLTLFLCNVFFFIKTTHAMYLIYGVMLVGIVVLHLTLHDHISPLFPNHTGIQERIYNLAALSCLTAVVFFSRLYLDTKRHLPTMDKVLILIGSINALFAFIFAVMPERINIMILSAMVVATLIILTFHAIYAFVKNVPYSGYYLAARILLFTGHFAWILSVYGIIPSQILLEWGLTITIILEALIHFTGMIAQTTPLLQKYAHRRGYSQAEMFDLLSDLSSRLRRQINVIGGGIAHLKPALKSADAKLFLDSSQVANNNIKSLIKRVDVLTDIKGNLAAEQAMPLALNKLIDEAHENFQQLDQDDTNLTINLENTEQVEVLQNATLIKHLIEVLAQEFKHFSDQALNLHFIRHEINREGVTMLEIQCSPLPTRVHSQFSHFDLGMSYIRLVIDHLNGKLVELNNNSVDEKTQSHPSINIQIPIRVHLRQTQPMDQFADQFDIILFGQSDEDMQKAQALTNNHNHKVEQFSELETLIGYFQNPDLRQSGSVILVFDNGGHIPHVTLQRLLPLMRDEDQCLLISKNVKMSLDYTQKLGFDDLLSCADIDDELETRLTKLIQKGVRLKSSPLSRIKALRKSP